MIKIEETQHTVRTRPKGRSALLWTQVATIVLLLVIAFQLNTLNNNISGMAVAVPEEEEQLAPTPRQPPPTQPSPSIDLSAIADDDAVKGDLNAPVTIVEWSDYECPYCVRFVQQTLGKIDEEYIQTGKVKFIFRDFPLRNHANAQKAAEAAECAGEQDKYYEMHDMLFEKGVKGSVPSFKQFAEELGLNIGEFNTCLDSGKMAPETQKDMADGQRAGVTGTPGFLINGKVVKGAQPFENFKSIIDAELT